MLVFIANVTVIVVYLKKMQIRTSQTFYKISLALSDIFTGIVIFPNIIIELSALVWKPVDQSALSVTEVNCSCEENGETYKAISNVGGSFMSKFSTSYLNFLGFFVAITVSVSSFTLVIASGDRCYALYKPFSYRQAKMKMVSIILIIVVWLSCSLVGIVPMVVNSFPYFITASLVVAGIGNAAVYLYFIEFVVLLLAMWVLSAFSIYLISKHEKNKTNLNKNRRARIDTERRITRTLLLMVAAFSLNIFPMILFYIIVIFLDGVKSQDLYLLPDNPSGTVAFNAIQLVAVRILFCNSLANVFIYSVRQKDFYNEMTNWYKDIWKGTVCKCL